MKNWNWKKIHSEKILAVWLLKKRCNILPWINFFVPDKYFLSLGPFKNYVTRFLSFLTTHLPPFWQSFN